jgi:type I restriction enzyme S subunit
MADSLTTESTKADSTNLTIITDHIDIWTSAIKQKSSSGRGSSKKFSLHGIKKLRELILDLAVRGKLVPQDTNDEPASVLLERIAAEKTELVKEGQLKKQKPLPKLQIDEVDFNLPSGWAIAYIPEVVAYEKYAIKRGPFGSALKKAFFVSDGIKVYEQQHAIKDNFALGEYYITEEKFKELSPFEVKPNDLIISCSGTVGKVAVAPEWMHKGIINQALLKITLNQAALTNSYFKILFPAFYMQTETLSDLQGTAQKNMVSVDTLKKEPFPLPSLEEQHRIVAKVDELMRLCDALEAQTEASISAHQTLVETLLNALLLPNTTQPLDAQTVSGSKTANSANSAASSEHAQNPEPNLKGSLEPSLANSFAKDWQRVAEHFDTLFTTSASIDTLKQTILQLAVMGKLVEQDANDEPAAKLLERIAEEKAQLIADKKIKKQKPLAAITDEEKPFELPSGWEWVRFGSLFKSFSNGLYKPAKFYTDEGVISLRMYNIQNGVVDFSGAKRVEVEASELAQFLLEPDDLLINRVNSKELVGKTAIIPVTEEPLVYESMNMRAKPFSEHLSAKYLNLFMMTGIVQDAISSFAKEAIGQASINQGQVSSIKTPIPPLEEQQRIVAKVDELMALCDQLKTRLSDAQTTQLHLTDAIVEQAV